MKEGRDSRVGNRCSTGMTGGGRRKRIAGISSGDDHMKRSGPKWYSYIDGCPHWCREATFQFMHIQAREEKWSIAAVLEYLDV